MDGLKEYDFCNSIIISCKINNDILNKNKYKQILNDIYNIINSGTKIITVGLTSKGDPVRQPLQQFDHFRADAVLDGGFAVRSPLGRVRGWAGNSGALDRWCFSGLTLGAQRVHPGECAHHFRKSGLAGVVVDNHHRGCG